jgi:hypothetical protein
MTTLTRRGVGALARPWVLTPERYDPRRTVAGADGPPLGSVVAVVTRNITPAREAEGTVLVLDTGHADDGFVRGAEAPRDAREIGTAKRALQPGDVIISRLRPYLRQIAFVDPALFDHADHVVASTEFFVLRRSGQLDPAALVPYLLSPPVQTALAHAQEGGHHPRFGRDALKALAVPAWAGDEADALADEVRTLSTARLRAARRLTELAAGIGARVGS